MQLLVTGGAGYIGSHLTDTLLAAGHTVVALDNLSTGSARNLSDAEATGRFQFVSGDIRDKDLVGRLVRECDGVYHLAAVVGVRHVIERPLEMLRVNVGGTETVLAACADAGKPALVASSSEVYGEGKHHPFKEDEPSVIGPTSQARWGYALAKALDEHLAFAYSKELGPPMVAVRYFNSYGPRLDKTGYGSVIARFISQALNNEPFTVYGGGQQTRSFTYVDDTVRGTIAAFTAALDNPEVRGKVFNIGYPDELTILELVETIRRLTGSSSKVAHFSYEEAYGVGFAEPPRRAPDMTRSRDLLGFVPEVSLSEGLPRTIAWAREAWQPHTPATA